LYQAISTIPKHAAKHPQQIPNPNRGKAASSFDLPRLEGTKSNYHCRNLTNKGGNMKKIVLSIALAFVAPFAWAQVSETTTTTTTTDANGTITEYTPGSAIVLKETSGQSGIASARLSPT
jgi:hypothetical protein